MPFVGFYQIKRAMKTRRIISPFFVLVLTIILLSYNLLNFINLTAVNILFWDQWDLFNAYFYPHSPVDIFFWQHGPHRQGIAFIIDGFLYQLSGWNTHTESMLIGVIIIIACFLAIYLKYRLTHTIQYSDLMIPLIFLNLSQFELFIGTPNPSHGSFSLLILMLYLLSWLTKNNFRKYLLINFFNFLLIYSGFGLFIGFITPFAFLIDYFKKQQSLKIFIFNLFFSLISIGSFFINHHFQSAVDCFKFPDPQFYLYPLFISRMFASFVSLQNFSIISYLLGLLLLALIIYILVKTILNICIFNMRQYNQTNYPYSQRLVIIILLSFSIIFAVNTSIGRLCLGINGADSSRYCTYLIPAFLGIYFYLLNIKQEAIKKIVFVVFAVTLLYTNFKATSNPGINWYSEGKTSWKKCYLKYEDIYFCGQYTNFKIYPDPTQTDLKYKLDYLKLRSLNLYNHN